MPGAQGVEEVEGAGAGEGGYTRLRGKWRGKGVGGERE